MSSPLPAFATRLFPLGAADQCVKCGLCLPACPTYGVTRNEGDSPRGRIMLMQGLATGAVGPGPALRAHLDGCLTCRACEAVCPAEVPYGRLIDSVRQVLAEAAPRDRRAERLLATVLTRKALRLLAALLLLAYQRSGLQWLVRKTRVLGGGRLVRLESLLPRIHWPRRPAPRPGHGQRIALFTNCTSPLVEPATLDAAARLLARVGGDVVVPAAQTCCGALHQHAGLAGGARACASRNLRAFESAEAVIGIASGCTAQLLDYDDILGPAGAPLAGKSVDLHRFLALHPRRDALRFRPLPARVLLHAPCTLRNVLKDAAHVRSLLQQIPELRVERLESGCCGAAGSYFLTQPAMADRLLEPLLAQIAADPPDYVLSANVGCAMHLAADLRRAGIKVPVWHPARLLAQQLGD